ncbi:MAG: response regulator [Methylococcaceae bacterium]|nr:response regulator [Methylococcaceae bacterium]
MTDSPIILVVDDDPFFLKFFEETFADHYQFEFTDTGEECLKKLQTIKPDLILLDVKMPGISGIETCEKLKSNLLTEEIPVIFVSALSLPEERMAGYKAGGEDYITKPFNEEELLTKIEITLVSQQEKEALQQSSNDAIGMAMTAMTQASEMGEVMQFTRDSYHCLTQEALAKRLLESLSQFDLSTTIRVTVDKQDTFFSTLGIVGDREQDVMSQMKQGERFIHFGKRTIINFKNISVLIKNMPIKDVDRYGRLNDVTGMLLEGADARITGLEMSSSLMSLVNATRTMLTEIESSRKENEKKHIKIIDDLISNVEWSYINMNLSEQQEQFFSDLLEKAKGQSSVISNSDFKIEKETENLISLLSVS